MKAEIVVTDRDDITHVVQAETGLHVMEILRELDYGVAAICGGLCSCATCHVYIDPQWMGQLPAPMSDELEILRELPSYRASTSRLSCQVEFSPELSGIALTIASDT
jgi:2Fe-2S ferredoxin